MRNTRSGLSKRQQNPQRTQLPPAVPAKRQLSLDSRWRFLLVAKQPKQLLRTLIACVLLPALKAETQSSRTAQGGCGYLLTLLVAGSWLPLLVAGGGVV